MTVLSRNCLVYVACNVLWYYMTVLSRDCLGYVACYVLWYYLTVLSRYCLVYVSLYALCYYLTVLSKDCLVCASCYVQRMEFTFHSSYVILVHVLSTMMLSTEFSCWCKSYPSKPKLLIGWSHHYKHSTVVITIWLTVTKYPNLKWQWIFYFLRRNFLSVVTGKTFTGLGCVYE